MNRVHASLVVGFGLLVFGLISFTVGSVLCLFFMPLGVYLIWFARRLAIKEAVHEANLLKVRVDEKSVDEVVKS
jgi:hypothetical protein